MVLHKSSTVKLYPRLILTYVVACSGCSLVVRRPIVWYSLLQHGDTYECVASLWCLTSLVHLCSDPSIGFSSSNASTHMIAWMTDMSGRTINTSFIISSRMCSGSKSSGSIIFPHWWLVVYRGLDDWLTRTDWDCLDWSCTPSPLPASLIIGPFRAKSSVKFLTLNKSFFVRILKKKIKKKKQRHTEISWHINCFKCQKLDGFKVPKVGGINWHRGRGIGG